MWCTVAGSVAASTWDYNDTGGKGLHYYFHHLTIIINFIVISALLAMIATVSQLVLLLGDRVLGAQRFQASSGGRK